MSERVWTPKTSISRIWSHHRLWGLGLMKEMERAADGSHELWSNGRISAPPGSLIMAPAKATIRPNILESNQKVIIQAGVRRSSADLEIINGFAVLLLLVAPENLQSYLSNFTSSSPNQLFTIYCLLPPFGSEVFPKSSLLRSSSIFRMAQRNSPH